MTHMTVGPNFRIIHDEAVRKGILRGFVYNPFVPCNCDQNPCVCPAIPEQLRFVTINAGKSKFVRAIGPGVGYRLARRLWATAKLHVETV